MCWRQGNRGMGTTQRERRKTVVSLGEKKKPVTTETPSWVVVDFEGHGFKCERCGNSERHSMPTGKSRLESFVLRGQAFAIDHADCKEKSNG